MEMLQNALNGIDSVSSYVLVAVLIPTGLYFTIRTGVIQVRMLPEMFRTLAEPGGRDSEGNKNISPFRAFSISAASRVGTANIAGVALAISLGGPGAVFWMWLTAVVGGATAFAESALGQVYKMKDGPNFRGGPAYYIRHGMNMKWLGLVFAVIVAITYGIVFNTVQSNSIVDAVGASFNVEDSNFAFSAIAGVVIAVGAYLIFVGGAKRISNISAYLVPIMAGLYLIVGIIVVVLNLGAVPDMILTIFADAFSIDSIAGGTLGSIMLIGVQRGLFSNEAGIRFRPECCSHSIGISPGQTGIRAGTGRVLRHDPRLLDHSVHHPAVEPRIRQLCRRNPADADGAERAAGPVGNPLPHLRDLPLRLLLDPRQLLLRRSQYRASDHQQSCHARVPGDRDGVGLHRGDRGTGHRLDRGEHLHGDHGSHQPLRSADALTAGVQPAEELPAAASTGT